MACRARRHQRIHIPRVAGAGVTSHDSVVAGVASNTIRAGRHTPLAGIVADEAPSDPRIVVPGITGAARAYQGPEVPRNTGRALCVGWPCAVLAGIVADIADVAQVVVVGLAVAAVQHEASIGGGVAGEAVRVQGPVAGVAGHVAGATVHHCWAHIVEAHVAWAACSIHVSIGCQATSRAGRIGPSCAGQASVEAGRTDGRSRIVVTRQAGAGTR